MQPCEGGHRLCLYEGPRFFFLGGGRFGPEERFLGGGFKFFLSYPYFVGSDPTWRAYFSTGWFNHQLAFLLGGFHDGCVWLFFCRRRGRWFQDINLWTPLHHTIYSTMKNFTALRKGSCGKFVYTKIQYKNYAAVTCFSYQFYIIKLFNPCKLCCFKGPMPKNPLTFPRFGWGFPASFWGKTGPTIPTTTGSNVQDMWRQLLSLPPWDPTLGPNPSTKKWAKKTSSKN